MLEYQTSIRYAIVLAILHILIGIVLTNKLQNRHIELLANYFLGSSVRIASILVVRRDSFGRGGHSRLGGGGGESQVFTTSVSIPALSPAT